MSLLPAALFAQTLTFDGPDGRVTVVIHGQRVRETDLVTVVRPSDFPSEAPKDAHLQATHVGIQMTIDKRAELSRPVMLSVPFTDSEIAGLEKDKLVLARYDDKENMWVPYVSRVDTVNNVVTAYVNHSSLYQIMGMEVPVALAQQHSPSN